MKNKAPKQLSTAFVIALSRLQLAMMARLLCAVFILQLSSELVTAQQQVEPRPNLLTKEIAASPDQTVQKGPQSELPETPTMLQAREDYTVFAWKNRQDAFAWQSVSTKVIFGVVIIVVLAGLYLSWMQFNFAHNAPLKVTTPSTEGPAIATTPTNPSNGVNTIEVNTSGVKITSSVIGLVILTLSIVFFFLYLKFVYLIIEL